MRKPPSSGRQLDRLVELLADSAREAWSQAELARSMGVSPAELPGVLSRFQAEGWPLEVRSDQRVRLPAAADMPVASRVRPHLSTKRLGRRFRHTLKVDSTNDSARRLAEAGAAEGTVVVAEEQTGGRGRLGRTWLSRRGRDILLSLVFRPDVDPARAPGLNLVVGLAAGQAIGEVAGIPTDLKWPNDVLTGGGKCCGVLTEMNADPGKIRFLIVG
ncbi:MAG: biotin--[acetyl-CoA-carboxylase] ligase, partial [Acidobacteria bacterium]|nr:biotin--[acetyl-CoA-carboxylase] ligase [Acidobacteriota bacterium]